jgi:hypothetical protein
MLPATWISRLPETAGDKLAKRKFKSLYFHLNIAELRTEHQYSSANMIVTTRLARSCLRSAFSDDRCCPFCIGRGG